MTAPPMRRWQNLLALLATTLAALALVPLEARVRLLCALFAIALICAMFLLRLRAHRARRSDLRVDDVYARIARIRAQRRRR